MTKYAFNYESGEYEYIDRDGYSWDQGQYVISWDDSEYRREEEEEERRREEERREEELREEERRMWDGE